MYLKNMLVYSPDHHFYPSDIEISDGIIRQVIPSGKSSDECRYYVIPGLVDIHFHGCMGVDLCDGDPDSLRTMAEYEASHGVTTICPASMTMSPEELHGIMKNAGEYEEKSGAHFAGINMEGPFISKKKKGAQAEKNIIPCDIGLFRQLQVEARGRIRLVDLAPEEPGAMEFIDEMKAEVTISIAHTDADYDVAVEAFKRGARHVTHLCNAMPPLHHREPGVIGAAADMGAYVEMICDGIHIHPSMVRAMFKLFTAEKICLISDSMRAAGLQDGQYTLGGQEVTVKGSLATLSDGTIAGSVTNLMACMKNAVKNMGISLEDAVRCASENPAKAIGIYDRCGSIEAGKQADMVLMDRDMNVVEVMVGGKIYQTGSNKKSVF